MQRSHVCVFHHKYTDFRHVKIRALRYLRGRGAQAEAGKKSHSVVNFRSGRHLEWTEDEERVTICFIQESIFQGYVYL